MGSQETGDQFAAAARSMRREQGVDKTLARAVDLAVDLIDGCEAAGVSLVHRNKRIDTPAATGATVRHADELQYELGEGPCLDAVWKQPVVYSADLTAETRWPRWGKAAAALDVRSMLCLRLFTGDKSLGALNLYSARVDGFSAHDQEEGLALAAHVAVALGAAQQVESLDTAVVRRTIIGQAEGILMERFALSADQAFAVLRRVSQDRNIKLYDVAMELVMTRTTPGA